MGGLCRPLPGMQASWGGLRESEEPVVVGGEGEGGALLLKCQNGGASKGGWITLTRILRGDCA